MSKNPYKIDSVMVEQLWNKLEVGLAYVGLDGTWLRTNTYLCEVLEYTEKELEGRTFQSLTHPDDLEDDLKMIEYLKTGKISEYTISKRYITKLGKVIWIKLKVNPVMDEDGQLVFFLSQIQPKHHAEFKEDFTGIVEQKFKLSGQPIVNFVKTYWWQLGAIGTTFLGILVTGTITWANTVNAVQNNNQTINDVQAIQVEMKENIHNIAESLNDIRVSLGAESKTK